VIGADGAHSAVRQELGVAMEGLDDLSTHTTALFRAPLWEVVGDRRYGLYMIMNSASPAVLVPAGRGDRWLYAREWPPGQVPEPRSADDVLSEIRAATGVPDLRPRIERLGRFSFAAQVAERFRSGRVFLVGDAAHRVTPRGGTGMNTAVRSAFDLGWKLGWVLSGWSGPALLDSYEAECGPVAVRNVARSARRDGSRRELADGIAEDLGGRVAHYWIGDGVSTLDLVGPGFTLLAGPGGAAWREAAQRVGAAVAVDVRELDEAAAGAVGIESCGAAMVRPDGQVVVRWGAMESFRTSALRIGMDAVIGRAEARLSA
jgi:hypothetical protein